MLKNNVRTGMLVVLYLAAFVSSFNENIMNVALASLSGDLSVSTVIAQWLVTGYMIVTAVIIAVSAFLTRRYSLRSLFYVAGACLVVGEVVDFVAPSFWILLVGRLLQAVASGLFIPLMMGTVLDCAPREKVGTYLSIGSATITIGPALAPVVSGVAVTLFGWRSIFVFPAVFTFGLLVAGSRLVRSYAPTEDARCDGKSVVLAALGLTLFVYGLGELASDLPWALLTLALGTADIAWFVHLQGKLEDPVLDVRPLKSARFLVANALVMISMMTTFSMSVLLPLYYEAGFGYTALVAGLLILPPIIVNALTAVLGGRVMDRKGEWPLIPLGFACIVCGQGLVAATGAGLSLGAVIAGSVITYAGVGLVMSPSQTSGLRLLAPELHASGVSIVNVLVMVAASIGPSLFIGILEGGAASASATGTPQALAQAAGFSQAVLVACAIAAAGFVVSVPYARRMSRLQQAEPAADRGGETTVAELMIGDPSTVAPDASMREVLQKLVERESGGVTVVDSGRHVLGILSDGDVMRALSGTASRNIDLGTYLAAYENDRTFSERVASLLESDVSDLATERVVCVPESAGLQEACDLFYQHHLKRLPVVDAEGRLVGLLNRNAISRYLMGAFIR